jgi:hypothetical protein
MRQSSEASTFTAPDRLEPTSAEAGIQLSEALPQHSDILRARRLELAEILVVDMGDLAGLDAAQQLDDPVSLFMPILCAHDNLRAWRTRF